MKIEIKNSVLLISMIVVFFMIPMLITTPSITEKVVLSSFERGNQVNNVTGHFLLSNDPNSITTLILGFNGTFGNASGAWILDTYYAKDLREMASTTDVFVVVKYIPRLPPSQINLKEKARILIYINDYLVYEKKLTYIIPTYGLIPANSSESQIFIKDGSVKVHIPLAFLSDNTEVKLEVQNNAIWEVDSVGIIAEMNTYDLTPYWLRNLPIMILFFLLAIIFLLLCLKFLVRNTMKEKDKIIILLFILGFIIRITLAPFTQDEWDLPYFRNVSLAYYLAGVNPLSVWTYGVAWLGTLLSFSSVGLVLQQLFLKSIYPPYILNMFIKLPSILADILIPSFIYFYRRDLSISDTNIKRIIVLWIFNPYTILISSVWGQFDAIPTLLMLLSLIFLIKRNIFKSAILLALGSLFKFFPVLVLPLLCIALLKAKKVSHLVFYITIVGIIMIQQAIAYYFFAPYLLINILGYRAGIGQWSDYYQGLTYLNLLWRYDLTQYLRPAPFLTLYVINFGVMLLIVLHKKSDVFNLANPHNIFILSLLSFIPFFLSYNMVNQQFIMWMMPTLLLLSYNYGVLSRHILGTINIILVIATLGYLFTPLRTFYSSTILDVSGFFFSIMLLIMLTFISKQQYKQKINLNKSHYMYVVSALAVILFPIFLYDMPSWSLVFQIISLCIALLFLLDDLHFYIRSSSSLTNILCNFKGAKLVLVLFYVYVSLQIAFIGSLFQSTSIMKSIFEIAFYNWALFSFNLNNIVLKWLQIIVIPQILLSISALSAALFYIFGAKLNIYSITTPWLIISYIIMYDFHTPTGYSTLSGITLLLIFVVTHLLALFIALMLWRRQE